MSEQIMRDLADKLVLDMIASRKRIFELAFTVGIKPDDFVPYVMAALTERFITDFAASGCEINILIDLARHLVPKIRHEMEQFEARTAQA